MTIFSKEAWKKNWKVCAAAGFGLVIALALMFVPMAVVPVHAMQSYVVTENRIVPVTETVTVTETYSDTVSRQQPIFQDRFVPTVWDRYVILDAFIDLAGKTNPVIVGNFSSFDGRDIRFLVFNTYPYEVYPTAFSPMPIYQARQVSAAFSFVPQSSHYYFVFDNYAYSSTRYFKLNASLNWTETATQVRQVPRTETTYKEMPFQVPQQRDSVSYERRSLFNLIAG